MDEPIMWKVNCTIHSQSQFQDNPTYLDTNV